MELGEAVRRLPYLPCCKRPEELAAAARRPAESGPCGHSESSSGYQRWKTHKEVSSSTVGSKSLTRNDGGTGSFGPSGGRTWSLTNCLTRPCSCLSWGSGVGAGVGFGPGG